MWWEALFQVLKVAGLSPSLVNVASVGDVRNEGRLIRPYRVAKSLLPYASFLLTAG